MNESPAQSHPSTVAHASKTYSKRRTLGVVGYTAAALFLFTGFLLSTSAEWIYAHFGIISIAQLTEHAPTDGNLENIPSGFVYSFAAQVILLSFALTLGTFAFIYAIKKITKHSKRPRISFLPGIATTLITVPVLALSGVSFASTVGLSDYLETRNSDIKMDDYYQKPELIKPLPADKNIILIYLESMDDAFGDPDLIGENALTSLQEVTKDWKSLDRLSHYPSGGWTMPGIVSTHCGLPKRPPESEDIFFGGALCLGDFLHDAGYKSVWMGGADETFEDKGLFLESHGYDEVLMRSHWEELGEDVDTREVWGISDKRLFELAKDEVIKLRDEGEPFNLSLLTVDDHDPIYQWPYCPTTSDNATINAVRCQSDIVADFITFLKDNGFMENSIVVVMGDHSLHAEAKEAPDYMGKLSPDDRQNVPVFNRFYSPEPFEFTRTVDNQIHLYPTLLELLGGELKDGRAGLGVSMVGDQSRAKGQQTIVGKTTPEVQRILSIPKLPAGVRIPQK